MSHSLFLQSQEFSQESYQQLQEDCSDQLTKEEQDFDQFLYQADFKYLIFPKEAHQPFLILLEDFSFDINHLQRQICHGVWSLEITQAQQQKFEQFIEQNRIQQQQQEVSEKLQQLYQNISKNQNDFNIQNSSNNNKNYAIHSQKNNFQQKKSQSYMDQQYYNNSSQNSHYNESDQQQDLQQCNYYELPDNNLFNMNKSCNLFAKKVNQDHDKESHNSQHSTRLPTTEDDFVPFNNNNNNYNNNSINSFNNLNQNTNYIFEKLQPLQDKTNQFLNQNQNQQQSYEESEILSKNNSHKQSFASTTTCSVSQSEENETFFKDENSYKISEQEEQIRKELEDLEQNSEQMCQLLSSNDKIKYKSAFKLFKLDFIAKIKDTHPDLDFRARTCLLKDMWKEQSQEQKLYYVKRSRMDKIRAIKELTQNE